MKKSQTLNYIFVAIGILVAMYAKIDPQQNKYLLIVGICCLMFGVYRISQTIPSNKDSEENLKNDED